MEMRIGQEKDLGEVVAALLPLIEAGYSLFLFSGDLGTGKTTLIKALSKRLGVEELVSSPTFSLVNEYASSLVGSIIHMDLYRLEKSSDLVQIGIEEYLHSGNLCLIEWPDIAQAFYTIPFVRVKIEAESDKIRIFNITTHDAVDA